MTSIYQAIQGNSVAYYGKSERDVVLWLEHNGGGIYKNPLHCLSLTVASNPEHSISWESLLEGEFYFHFQEHLDLECEDYAGWLLALARLRTLRNLLTIGRTRTLKYYLSNCYLTRLHK